ncbi:MULTISPECIES: carbohydrate ABC transporter permease [Oerskovia]|uniref:sn-glycerol-3-phosphate transport system permease protein UgpA n=2 Tax=Oerskovia TaxID=162491 RepID=A0A163T525_9CELL|nr:MULTISPECIES: sugar ABC transporter permease [Oerskovia]KZM37105.1 sn-glycerol-3-phosphate transport system permease protein UgpA [Oerskovia enterophila]MBD7981591.1 sugar ABC transporter permease [Oerskovia merdavium]
MTTTTPVRPSAPPAARRRRPGASRRQAAPWGFLAPAIVLFVLFLALPIAYAVYLSFRTEKVSGLGLGSGARTEVWNGFANYAASLADPEFLASVGRVALYGVIVVPTMLGLALLFALLLDSRRSRATKFSRISIFLPYAVPAVISSLLWGFLYLPGVSPFYYVFDRLGWDVPSLFSSDLVIFAVANIAVWGGVGFNMVVIYTSLRAIPSELYEAAELDGCNQIGMAWRIKIPIVVPSIIMTFVFSMIATLQVFAEPTTLKPLSNTISSTWTPLMKVYRDAFIRGDLYSAAATSVIIAVATFVLSFGFLRLVQSRAFGQEK